MNRIRIYLQLTILALVALMMAAGPSAAQYSIPDGRLKVGVQPAPEWFFHDVVDVDFVKAHVVVPRSEKVMIIDSRPYQTKYVKGYIPTAVSIPTSKFDSMSGKLPKDKDALLIFYCGGMKCKLSHKAAAKAEALGYTNVKVFAKGFPAWKAAGQAVGVPVEYVKARLDAGDPYLLVDARPARKYLAGAIPSAVSIPDSKAVERAGLLPADKNVEIIYYCGGFKCKLSHKSAAKALALGHTRVLIAEAGYPAWKKAYGAGAGPVQVKGGKVEGSIDLKRFKEILAKNPGSIMLVDVRDADEFATGHFPGAVNIPVDDLEKRISELPSDKPVVFTCATGARGGEAFYMVKDLRPELDKVYYVEGEVDCNAANECTVKAN